MTSSDSSQNDSPIGSTRTFLGFTDVFVKQRCKGFEFNDEKVFVVYTPDATPEYIAYRNSCPHQHIPLDWDNDQFLDADDELIQCSSHGALFTIENGRCVAGPCIGERLTPVAIAVEHNKIYALEI